VLEIVEGNIFSDKATAVVIPVNAVGAPGKGLALDWAQRYPLAADAYKLYCRQHDIWPGDVFVASWKQAPTPICFVTKAHWLDATPLLAIHHGLIHLARLMEAERFESVALPAVGAGLGGLPWAKVLKLVRQTFDDPASSFTFTTKVHLYKPLEVVDAARRHAAVATP
jgi:O-acetyl-ADP-ribose deacetylase (regulator of RNase III)